MQGRPWKRWAGGLACVILTSGCAVPGLRPAQPARDNLLHEGPVGECARLYRDVDATVTAAGARDAQAVPVPGLPYLRMNRFLAAAGPDPESGETFRSWVDRLRRLDHRARTVEIANLPEDVAAADWPRQLATCARVLRRHDLASPEVRASLAAHRVPDDYRPMLRVLGLYPLVSIPFLQGVLRLHQDIRETFATPLDELAVEGALRRIGPGSGARLSPGQVAAMLERAAENPLGIPDPAPADRRRLFHTFAPVWEIDTASGADRPGRPLARPDTPPLVDGEPAVFTHVSHTRWQGRYLLQLNYVIWFPARPRQGPFDLAGGHLDGITWRVTLGVDGEPLIYDAMHNCGCYYKAFPTPRVALTTRSRGWEEPISVPQAVDDGPGRLVLRVATVTHYLQRVYHETGTALDDEYDLASYQTLRSLPLEAGGRRSLFGADAIVPGTRRRERWLFWPMGVPSPGAMRQWGNHAIAFVGRRHFDDPGLLERYFAPSG